MRCGFSYDLFMQKLELIEHNSHHKSIRRWDRMLNIFAGKRKRSKINNNFRIFFFSMQGQSDIQNQTKPTFQIWNVQLYYHISGRNYKFR